MSTELYLECRSHTPFLSNGEQVGNNLTGHLKQLRFWLQRRNELIELATRQRDLELDPFDTTDDYYRRTLVFVLEHRSCEIGIRDEYGKEHPITPEADPL